MTSLRQNLAADLVAVLRRRGHLGDRELSGLRGATERSLCAFINCSADVAQDCPVRRPSLDAADLAARAERSVSVSCTWPKLACRAGCASIELAIEHDSRADSGTHGNSNEGVDAGATPEPLFGSSQCVGVILEDNWVPNLSEMGCAKGTFFQLNVGDERHTPLVASTGPLMPTPTPIMRATSTPDEERAVSTAAQMASTMDPGRGEQLAALGGRARQRLVPQAR